MASEEGGPAARSVLAFIICIFGLSLASSASGEEANTLARAQELIQSFEYEEALELLETLASDERTADPERVQALELMGVLHFNLDQHPRARQMFERLLNVDPEHELTDTSYPPRLLQFYASIRDSFVPQVSNDIEVDASQEPQGSGDSSSGFSYSNELDGREGDDDDGADDDGAREGRRWYASWWFWTIVGVVVAGGVSTALVFTLRDEPQEGTLGTRSLP